MNAEERKALMIRLIPGIEGLAKDKDGNVILYGPATVYWNFLQHKHGLRLEIRSGMKVGRGGSLVKSAIEKGYVPKGTRKKQDAVQFMNELDAEMKILFELRKQEFLAAQQKENADV